MSAFFPGCCCVGILIFKYPKAIWLSGTSSLELRLIAFFMAFEREGKQGRFPVTLGGQSLPVFK